LLPVGSAVKFPRAAKAVNKLFTNCSQLLQKRHVVSADLFSDRNAQNLSGHIDGTEFGKCVENFLAFWI